MLGIDYFKPPSCLIQVLLQIQKNNQQTNQQSSSSFLKLHVFNPKPK